MSTQEKSSDARMLGFRLVPWVGAVAVVALVLLANSQWGEWTSNRTIQSTQNAFVKTDPVVMSAKVSGYIKALPVGDYQPVRAGQLIALIDDGDYAMKVATAEAELAKAQAQLHNLAREVAQQHAKIKESQANVHAAQVRVQQHKTNPARQPGLVQEGVLSRQVYESAQAELDYATSQRDAALAQAELANRSLDVLEGQRELRFATVRAAQAELESARREQAYTRIVAPFDGVLGKRHVQQGSLVSGGTQIVSLLPTQRPHIIANYKETQLAHIRPGQPATFTVDGLPGHSFRGHAGEIAPMSGADSSLLPADNASGNFTKVVQRIPIRIELEPGQPDLERLRSGMSVEVSIDTQGTTTTADALAKATESPTVVLANRK
ncbi:HlyD family secretion protein [Comamonas sp. MYb21]|uniref:HlyD family secretion protein n=1 Tax=Comamonas sp. MYb21 TaxID=1848648 RepID=UPI0030A495E4